MPIRLNHAVVHELVKEVGTPETRVDLAKDLLNAEGQVVIDLVDQIVGLIGRRENVAHFGVFRNDPERTRIPDKVTSYCLNAKSAADTRFLELTNDCMAALRDRARAQNLATGGYLLFADYTSTSRFLLVAMIKQRSGITMEGLVPTNITELDLSKLHQVARVSFDRLRQYEDAVQKQDMTYLTFVSPQGSRQAAGYFVTALGCEPGTPAAIATRAAIVAMGKFFDAHAPIQPRGYEARVELLGFFQSKADNNERVGLYEIVELARRYFPSVEADHLSDEFHAHLQGEDHRIPAEFPVSKSAVNRFTRFTYRSSQLKVEIDKAAVTREDSGPIYFDEANRRLVISDEDFIAELGAALQGDE